MGIGFNHGLGFPGQSRAAAGLCSATEATRALTPRPGWPNLSLAAAICAASCASGDMLIFVILSIFTLSRVIPFIPFNRKLHHVARHT